MTTSARWRRASAPSTRRFDRVCSIASRFHAIVADDSTASARRRRAPTPSTRPARRLDDDTKEVRAVSFNYARTERTFFDQELKGHFDRLEGMGPDKAEVSLVSKTRDEATWVVSFRRDDGPTEYSLYDTKSNALTPLFVSQPALSDYKFAPVWKSTSVSGRVRNRHRHAIEHVSRRWRAGRRGDSGRTRRKFDLRTGSRTWKTCEFKRGTASSSSRT